MGSRADPGGLGDLETFGACIFLAYFSFHGEHGSIATLRSTSHPLPLDPPVSSTTSSSTHATEIFELLFQFFVKPLKGRIPDYDTIFLGIEVRNSLASSSRS